MAELCCWSSLSSCRNVFSRGPASEVPPWPGLRGLLQAPSWQPLNCAVRDRYSLWRPARWQSYSMKLMPASWLQHWDEGAFILSQYLSSPGPPLHLASRTTQRQLHGVLPLVGLGGWRGGRCLEMATGAEHCQFSRMCCTAATWAPSYLSRIGNVPRFLHTQIKQKNASDGSIESHLSDTMGGFWPMQKAKIRLTSAKWVNCFSSTAEKNVENMQTLNHHLVLNTCKSLFSLD